MSPDELQALGIACDRIEADLEAGTLTLEGEGRAFRHRGGADRALRRCRQEAAHRTQPQRPGQHADAPAR
jgi:hypothetical protein